jgi:hypothetical protein
VVGPFALSPRRLGIVQKFAQSRSHGFRLGAPEQDIEASSKSENACGHADRDCVRPREREPADSASQVWAILEDDQATPATPTPRVSLAPHWRDSRSAAIVEWFYGTNVIVMVNGALVIIALASAHGPVANPTATIPSHGPDQIPVKVWLPVMPLGKL